MLFNKIACCIALSMQFILPPVASSQSGWQQKVSAGLRASFDGGASADVLILFHAGADLRAAGFLPTKYAKAVFVFNQLEITAERSQAQARSILMQSGVKANSLYIANAIAAENLPADVCRQLADLPEVRSICPDPWVKMELPSALTGAAGSRNAVEWGVERIKAPAVWAMGYTGQGVTVGGADTGYDWQHPALMGHYRGWDAAMAASNHNYNWHDGIHSISPLNGDTSDVTANPCGLNISAPCDDQAHGTHTMGTMTGDDGQGNQIGVAPGAKWVGCRNMERGWGKPSSYLECFQWFLAPTDLNGQNPDPLQSPDVINNSWYCAYEEGCTDLAVNELLHVAVNNLRAAGVVVVVSNGNSGSSCGTTNSPPAYFEESFSVGSFAQNDTISGFSSRGPVLVDSSFRVKPNVAAPGSNVRSSTPNNGYNNFSGTSMAGPHVVGLVALMLSARPELAGHVEDIEDIVEQTAIPTDGLQDCFDNLGANYPNNTYGYGKVDAEAAVIMALNWMPPVSTHTAPPASVQCYPNPASDRIVFDLRFSTGFHKIEFFDPAGKRVFEQNVIVGSDRQILIVPVANLEAQIYFYKLSGETDVLTGKFLKK